MVVQSIFIIALSDVTWLHFQRMGFQYYVSDLSLIYIIISEGKEEGIHKKQNLSMKKKWISFLVGIFLNSWCLLP